MIYFRILILFLALGLCASAEAGKGLPCSMTVKVVELNPDNNDRTLYLKVVSAQGAADFSCRDFPVESMIEVSARGVPEVLKVDDVLEAESSIGMAYKGATAYYLVNVKLVAPDGTKQPLHGVSWAVWKEKKG